VLESITRRVTPGCVEDLGPERGVALTLLSPLRYDTHMASEITPASGSTILDLTGLPEPIVKSIKQLVESLREGIASQATRERCPSLPPCGDGSPTSGCQSRRRTSTRPSGKRGKTSRASFPSRASHERCPCRHAFDRVVPLRSVTTLSRRGCGADHRREVRFVHQAERFQHRDASNPVRRCRSRRAVR
jgi:hypothetical protein